MNREIKFQILYENKVEGYERLTEKGWEWMWISLNPDNGERWNKGTIQDSHKLIRRQYTGLKDRNGKDIYEGDVVMINHWRSSDLFDYSKPFLVKWQSGQINFKQGEYNNFIGSLVGKLEIEVIGNVHSNPELL